MARAILYEVCARASNGIRVGPRFRLLADALRYVQAQPDHASLGIRRPDGSWVTLPRAPRGAGARERRRPSPAWLKRARILVVDDDAGSREGLAELLRDEHYEVATAVDGSDALAQVIDDPPDLVITDVVMPRADGFNLVARLRQHAALSDMPIILVSAHDDRTRRIGGLDLGADDYLPKPLDPEELLARVRLHLRHANRSREIVVRSAVDELTGLLNRRGILDVLARERERARRDGTFLALFMIDVDEFKAINDSLGHSAGDEVLRRTAAKLVGAVRTNDRVGRFGGDEFLIVAPNTGIAAAEILAERIRNTRRKPIRIGGAELKVSLSVGSVVDHGALEPEALFDRADAAMYRQKQLHRRFMR